MASTCKANGCTKLAQHGKDGMCCTHFSASKQLATVPATEARPAKTAKTKTAPVCAVAGCTKRAQHGKDGMCKAHHSQALREAGVEATLAKPGNLTPARSGGVVTDPRVTFECPHCHIALSSAEVEALHCPACEKSLHSHVDPSGQVFTPGDFGKVTNGAGDKVPFGVDPVIYLALTEAMEAKKHDWLVELSGLPPGKAIRFAAQMITAIEGLGY